MSDRSPVFVVSAFGDEVHSDLEIQLELLKELGISHLELRKAWDINVQKFDDVQVKRVKEICAERDVTISCIGSPIGKTSIAEPFSETMDKLVHICEMSTELGSKYVRIFSFYPPNGKEGKQDDYVQESTDRLREMSGLAEKYEIKLILENEVGVVGDTPERCYELLKGVDRPSLQFVWDTANFAVVGIQKSVEQGWGLLAPYTDYVQIKDYKLSDRKIVPAGEGDGQVGLLLSKLRNSGYRGVLALEPHLANATRTDGFTGSQGMRVATRALRTVMAQYKCHEIDGL